MTFLYPQVLWLFLPLGMLFWVLKPKSLLQTVHLIILGLLITALSRPQLRHGLQEQTIDAKEILIALDVSYSMHAQDLSPDRYSYAKKTIKALLKNNAKDNIMLVAFTTNPLLLSPPTTDHQLIHTALDALEPKNILTKGTSLKRLFEKIATLKKIERDVILITDGGEEKDLQKLLGIIRNIPVHLTILATGTTRGTTVPTHDGAMLKDKTDHLVVSRINPMLERLADATDGTYLRASGSPQKDADTLTAQIQEKKAAAAQITKLRYSYSELYDLPLLIAVVLFLMLHTRASRYLLLIFTFAGMPLHASLFDDMTLHRAYITYEKSDYRRTKTLLEHVHTPSLQQRYALASAYYRLGDYKQARRLFSSIRTTSVETKQKLYYNIANTYTMEGRYDKARIYYTKALQLGEDADAAYNLALIAHIKDRHGAQLGIAHPKSQSSVDNHKEGQKTGSAKKKHTKENQQSSGSGSGGQKEQHGSKNEQQKGRLRLDENAQPLPLSSKVYELINKGYIRETQPW